MQQIKICYSLKPGSKYTNDDFKRLISGIFLILKNKIVEDQAKVFELYKYNYMDLSCGFNLIEQYAILMESDASVIPWDISDLYDGVEEVINFFDIVIGKDNNCDCIFEALSIFVTHKIRDVHSFASYCASIKDASLRLNIVCGVFPCLNFSEFPPGNAKTMASRRATIQVAQTFLKPFLEFDLFHRIVFHEYQWFKKNTALVNFLFSQLPVRQGLLVLLDAPASLPNLLKYDNELLYQLMKFPDFIEKIFPKDPHALALFTDWANSKDGLKILDAMFLKLDFAQGIFSRPHFIKQLCHFSPKNKNTALFGLSQQVGLSILKIITHRFSRIKLSDEDKFQTYVSFILPNQPSNPAEPISTVEGELEKRQTEEERQIVKQFFQIFLPQGVLETALGQENNGALVINKISERELSLLKNLYLRSKEKKSCNTLGQELQLQIKHAHLTGIDTKKSGNQLANLVVYPEFFDYLLKPEPELTQRSLLLLSSSVFYFWLKWPCMLPLVREIFENPAAKKQLITHNAVNQAIFSLAEDSLSPLHLLFQNKQLVFVLMALKNQIAHFITAEPQKFIALGLHQTIDSQGYPSCLWFDMFCYDEALFNELFNELNQKKLTEALVDLEFDLGRPLLVNLLNQLVQRYPSALFMALVKRNQTQLLCKLTQSSESFLDLVKDPKSNRKILAQAFQTASFLTAWNALDQSTLTDEVIEGMLRSLQSQVFSRLNSGEKSDLVVLLKAILVHPVISSYLLRNDASDPMTSWFNAEVLSIPPAVIVAEPVVVTDACLVEKNPTTIKTKYQPIRHQSKKAKAKSSIKPHVPAVDVSELFMEEETEFKEINSITEVAEVNIEVKAPVTDMQDGELVVSESVESQPIKPSTLPAAFFYTPPTEAVASISVPMVPSEVPSQLVMSIPDIESLLGVMIIEQSWDDHRKKAVMRQILLLRDENAIRRLVIALDERSLTPYESFGLDELKLVYLLLQVGLDSSVRVHLEVKLSVSSLIIFLNEKASSTLFSKKQIELKRLETFVKFQSIEPVLNKLNILIPIESILNLCRTNYSHPEQFIRAHLEIIGFDENAIQHQIQEYRARQAPVSPTKIQQLPLVIRRSQGEVKISEFIKVPLKDRGSPKLQNIEKFSIDYIPKRGECRSIRFFLAELRDLLAKYNKMAKLLIVGSRAYSRALGLEKEFVNDKRDLDLSILIGEMKSLDIDALYLQFTELLAECVSSVGEALGSESGFEKSFYSPVRGCSVNGDVWLSYKGIIKGINVDIRVLYSKRPVAELRIEDFKSRCLTSKAYSLDLTDHDVYGPFSKEKQDLVKCYSELTVDNISYVIWTFANEIQRGAELLLAERCRRVFDDILSNYRENSELKLAISKSFSKQFGSKMKEESQKIKNIGDALTQLKPFFTALSSDIVPVVADDGVSRESPEHSISPSTVSIVSMRSGSADGEMSPTTVSVFSM